RFHEPVVASRINVVPVFVRVPVRLIVPPVLCGLPRLVRVKLPPRFSVPPAAAVSWPLLDQFVPCSDNVPVLDACSVPLLVQLVRSEERRVGKEGGLGRWLMQVKIVVPPQELL